MRFFKDSGISSISALTTISLVSINVATSATRFPTRSRTSLHVCKNNFKISSPFASSFDRILREAEEAANVDESFKMSSLVRMIVQRHIVKQVAPKEFDNLGFYLPKRRRDSVSKSLPRRRMPPLTLKINNKKITLNRCFDQTYIRADEDDEQEIRKPKKWRRRGSGRMHIC
ncbi:hypothetical protein WN943_025076 [Citrus x changshan-huyou]